MRITNPSPNRHDQDAEKGRVEEQSPQMTMTEMDEEKASTVQYDRTGQNNSGSKDDSETFDGGRTAWLTLVGGWLAYFVAFGNAQAFGVYQDLYTRENGMSASSASWIGSTQTFFCMTAGLLGGKLLDTGHFKLLMLGASALFLFSNFMLSIADLGSYYQLLLAQGFGVGIGAGLLSMPAVAVQGHHWKKHRHLVMAMISTAGAVGGIIHPIMLNQLLNDESLGFSWGVRIWSFMALGLLAIANLLMKAKNHTKGPVQGEKPRVLDMLKDRPYMLMNVGESLTLAGLMFPIFYLQLFSVLRGVNRTLAFYMISIMNGASIAGRMVTGMLARKIGVLNMLIVCALACGSLTFAMFGIQGPGGAIVFALFYGFFSGSFLGLIAPSSSVFTRHQSEIGVRMGICFAIGSIGSLIGTPIVGTLLTGPVEEYPWYKPILFCSIMCLSGGSTIAVARFWHAARTGNSRI